VNLIIDLLNVVCFLVVILFVIVIIIASKDMFNTYEEVLIRERRSCRSKYHKYTVVSVSLPTRIIHTGFFRSNVHIGSK
jgi:uncharacterized membrane protein